MSKANARVGRKKSESPGLMVMPVGTELPTFPTRTREELVRWLDETIDAVNRLLVEAGGKHDAIADALFRGPFLNSARLALDPAAPLPPGVPELLERAGKSLALMPNEVRRYAKIGALNHHIREGTWRNLPFYMKKELVRLVDDAVDLDDFETGVLLANKANVGVEAVRAFVADRRPERADGIGKPRGLTPKGVVQLTARVAALDDDEARERLVERLADMEDGPARDRLIEDIDAASKNLAKVVAAVSKRVKRRGR